MPWSPPAIPPATADLRAALQILEADAAPATPKHVSWCLAKLMMAFEPSTKLSPEETKLRAAVWAEACGDLGDALWSSATMAALQGSKWMPKPAEFRAFVAVKFEERAKKISRCKLMLSGQAQAEQPKPFVQESRDVRLRAIRDSWRKIGNDFRAAPSEIQLAELEGREPEPWALNPQPVEASVDQVDQPVFDPLPPAQQATLKIALARKWRARGNTRIADQYEADARDLAPELFGEHRDVPEAA